MIPVQLQPFPLTINGEEVTAILSQVRVLRLGWKILIISFNEWDASEADFQLIVA